MKSFKLRQKGSTLVVVLVLLLVITILGTIAIRQSLVSLNIATNSQGQSLLMQSSDSALYNTEDPNKLKLYVTGNSMFGYIRLPANRDKELVFCYRRDQTDFFDMGNASVIYWVSGKTAPTNTELGRFGYCNPTVSGTFTSERKAVLTQISVRVGTSTLKPFANSKRGTDSESAKVDETEIIVVTATSVIPGLSSAAPKDIYDCFAKHMTYVKVPNGVTPATNADDSVTDCLARLNVPFNTQVSEYKLEQGF